MDNMQSNFDQASANASSTGWGLSMINDLYPLAWWSLFSRLREAGFSDVQAMQLLLEFVKGQMQLMANTRPKEE